MDRIEEETPAELQRRLRNRLFMAGGLIVILLGALAAFDHLSRMESNDDVIVAVTPTSPAIGPSITTGRPAEPATVDVPITPSPQLAPKDTSVVEAPPKPEISAQPSVAPAVAPAAPPAAASAPVAVPAPALPAKVAPVVSPAVVASRPPVAAATPPVPAPSSLPRIPEPLATPEGSAGTPLVGAPAGAARPARLPAPPAAVPPRPALSRLASGFLLQAGVFMSTERAEELKAKLVMAGVPVTIESRVQVGPFATQKEADEARRKIRQLGVDSILIPPRVGRR